MLGAHHAQGYIGEWNRLCSVLRPKDSPVSAVGHAGLFYGAIQTLTTITLRAEVMQAWPTFADKRKTRFHHSDSITAPMQECRKTEQILRCRWDSKLCFLTHLPSFSKKLIHHHCNIYTVNVPKKIMQNSTHSLQNLFCILIHWTISHVYSYAVFVYFKFGSSLVVLQG